MIQNCLLVMAGGALGALMRYGVARLCAGILFLSMPIGTFLANIAGCLILGILTGIGEAHAGFSKGLLLLLTVGMCGAFTTFSTFSSETIKMVENGQMLSALLYVTASISIGFVLFWLGKSLV